MMRSGLLCVHISCVCLLMWVICLLCIFTVLNSSRPKQQAQTVLQNTLVMPLWQILNVESHFRNMLSGWNWKVFIFVGRRAYVFPTHDFCIKTLAWNLQYFALHAFKCFWGEAKYNELPHNKTSVFWVFKSVFVLSLFK